MLEIVLIIIARFITGFFSGSLGTGSSILLLSLSIAAVYNNY